MKNSLVSSCKYIILTLLLAVPVFGFLDVLPIRIWDEARVAVNAFEMYRDGDYIVAHYDGTPDMWNTKPPLLLWMQVIFMKLIGPDEVAVRLPSSFAVFFTCLAILIFCLRYLKNFWIAFIAILGLITTTGYMDYHAARTGDYDAMLTCFTTTSCLFFYAFCETKQTRFLYWFFGALTLGMLTKGVAALLFTPALLIFALFTTPLTHFLKNKHFYIGLLSLAFFVIGFYLLRESRNPGYIATVQENELGGRYMVAQGGGEFDFWYYFKNIVDYSLADRYLLIPCGMLIGAFSRDRRIRKFSLFLTLCVVTYFLVISIAKTKVGWYNVPMYPFIAILIAFFVNFFFEFLRDLPKARESMARNVIPYLFLFLIFFSSYREVWSRTHAPDERFWDAEFYHIGAYLKDALRGNVSLQNKFLVSEGYFGQNLFYTHILRDRKINTGFKNIDDVKKGDVLLVYQDEVRKRLKEKFVCGEKCERWDIFTLMVGEPRE